MSKIGRTNYPVREEGGVGEEILPGPVANKIAVSSSSRSAGARTRAVRTEFRETDDEPVAFGKDWDVIFFSNTEPFLSYSRPDQEERQVLADQVQGPMLEAPLHPRPEGREA